MASLYAVMTRRTVTATVSGLDEEHEAGRIFRWYLDGVLKKTETVMDAITSRTCDIAGVRYASTHTVKVAISTASTDELFTTLTAYVADNLKLWDWSASNGDATAAQVSEAYTSANSQGLTADFSYLVWNDIVNGVYDVLTGRGEMWNTRYASLAETLMETAGDPLTADRFNSLVNNMQYEYPYWRNQRSRNGYLGRLAVLGQTTMGKNADIVYGEYFFELTYILNVLIDALGELDAGYAKLLKHTSTGGLRTSESLPLRVPGSRRMELDETLKLGAQLLGLTAPPSRPMEHSGIKKYSSAVLKFNAPPSRPLPITNRVRSIRSIVFIAQNESPLNLSNNIEIARSIILSPDASSILKLTWEIASVESVVLGWADSLPLALDCTSLSSAEGTALTPVPSFYLVASADSYSSLSALLTPSDESVLGADISNASGGNIVLSPDPSGILAIDWDAKVTATQRIHLIANKAPQLAHIVEIAPSITAELLPLEGAHMAHSAKVAVGELFLADMIAPTAVKMQHDKCVTLGTLGLADIVANPAVHFNYSAAETIGTLFAAALRAPKAAKMTYSAKEAIAALFAAALSPSPSVPMVSKLVETITALGGAILIAPTPRRMAMGVTEKPLKYGEAVLTSTDSLPLAADIVETLNDVFDAGLTSTDAEPLAVADGVRSALDGVLSPLPPAAMAHEAVESVDGTAEMRSPDAADGGVVSVVITVLSAVLEAKPTVEPTTDWATQDGTNLDIRRTYYNRVADEDSSVLLIDWA